MTMLQLFNELLQSLALVIAGVFVVSLTSTAQPHLDSAARLLTRYAGAVTVAFLLLLNSAQLAPGLLFDFRAVMVALAAQRHGTVAGLLVAGPLALYRLFLGGPGAWPAVLNLMLVALLAGWNTAPLRRTHQFAVGGRGGHWWGPFVLFVFAGMPIFLGFALAGRSPLAALPIYLAITALSSVGLLAGQVVYQTRLGALARTQALEQLAYLDPLTHAFNRRRFDGDTSQPDASAFLLLLDLDHFKRINDTYGHDAGDQALIATVRVLKELVRPTDRVYRLGGEEFAVLLAPCAPDAVAQMVERIRGGVARDVARRAGLASERITVSGGLVPLMGLRRAWLRAADELLYAAKAGGRNRIMIAPVPMPDAALRAVPSASTGTALGVSLH